MTNTGQERSINFSIIFLFLKGGFNSVYNYNNIVIREEEKHMKKFTVLFLSVAILFCSVVSGISISDAGVQFYFLDGSGYWLEF